MINQCLYCYTDYDPRKGFIVKDDFMVCEDCIGVCSDLLKLQLSEPVNTDASDDLQTYLKKYVHGQDELITLFMQLHNYNNLIDDIFKDKTVDSSDLKYKNCLLVGYSGVGKTFFLKKYCQHTDRKYVIIDCSQLSPEGYKGFNIMNIFTRLYQACDNDLEKMKSSIIVLDEFDKLDSTRNEYSRTIKAGFLKLLEGGEVSFPTSMGDHTSNYKTIDTRYIRFIFSGVFEGFLDDYYNPNERGIGFSRSKPKLDSNFIENSLLREGMTRELLGRMDEIIILNKLKKEDFLSLLKYSEASPCVQMQILLRKYNWNVVFSDETYAEIAKRMSSSLVGCRSANKAVFDKVKHLLLKSNEELTEVVI